MRMLKSAAHAGVVMLVAVPGAALAPPHLETPVMIAARTVWGGAEQVSPSGEDVTRVALDSAAGTTTYAWIGERGLQVVHRTKNSDWSFPQALDATATERWFLQVVSAPSGECITFPRWQSGQRQAVVCSGSDHVFSTPVALNEGGHQNGPVRLVVDDNGVWTIGWIERDPTNGTHQLQIRRRAGDGPWSEPIIVTSVRTKVRWFDLDTSPQGLLTVAWQGHEQYNPDSRGRIRERSLAPSGSWSRTTTLSKPGSGMPVVSSGSGEQADVAWIQNQPRLIQLRSKTASGWGPIRSLSPRTPRMDSLIRLSIARGGHGVTAVTWLRYRPWSDSDPGAVFTVTRRGQRWGRPAVVAPTKGDIECNIVHVDQDGTVRTFWYFKPKPDPFSSGYRIETQTHRLHRAWSNTEPLTPFQVDLWSDPTPVAVDESGRLLLGWLGRDHGLHAYLTASSSATRDATVTPPRHGAFRRSRTHSRP